MSYPEGAIKTVEELFEAERNSISVIYYASATYGIQKLRILAITLAQMLDGNIGKLNGYNDWFMFADENVAESYAKR